MIIGIGGASRSGKTSLAILIKTILENNGQTAIVLGQDDYAFPEESDIPKIKHRVDWERPESIDFEWYKKDIFSKQKEYQNVIAEGLFNFYDADINALFDVNFFTQISKKTFLERKKVDTRWGIEPNWYIEHIWKSYLKYGRTILEDSYANVVVLSGESEFNAKWIARILDFK